MSAKKSITLPLIIIAALIVGLIVFWIYPRANKTLSLNGQKISLELALTDQQQVQGLSSRPSLCQTCGMLFVFDKPQNQKFWMKDMNFPLDLIWLNDNKIVQLDKNLPPEGAMPKNFYPSRQLITDVLEVNAGFIDKYQLQIGQSLSIK